MLYTNNEILQAIWSRSTGRNVFLPMVYDGHWIEADPINPDDYRFIPQTPSAAEHYFTPLRYNGPRQKAFVGKPGVIFADLDNGLPDIDMPPSVLVISSVGHGHGYWFLDKPYDPVDWEPHAKGWSQELNADPGGWDLTQVLRIPNTVNRKYAPPHIVTVQQFEPERVYPLSAFPKAHIVLVPTDETMPIAQERLRDHVVTQPDLPLTARYWLTVTPQDLTAIGKVDRSRMMWETECKMLEAGFTDRDVFHAMHFSAINKWKEAPHKLWVEIQKAVLHVAQTP